MAILLLAEPLKVDVITFARVMGALFSMGTLTVLMLIAEKIFQSIKIDQSGYKILGLVFAVVMMAIEPSFSIWSAAGLETSLHTFLVLLFVYLVIIGAGPKALGLSLFLAFAARHEAALLALLIPIRFAGRDFFKNVFISGVVSGVLVSVLLYLRFWYYGEILPNTYYAKTGGGVELISRGFNYYLEHLADSAWYVIIPLVLFGLWTYRSNSQVRIVVIAYLLLLSPCILVGGDGLGMFRFLISSMGLLFVIASLGLQALIEQLKFRGIVIAGGLFLFVGINVWDIGAERKFGDIQYQKHVEIPNWKAVGEWLKKTTKPETLIAAVPIGALGYYSERPVLDMVGLVDKHIARTDSKDASSGTIGHLKHDGAYVLDRKPEILLLGNIFVTDKPRDPLDPEFMPISKVEAIYLREKDVMADPRFAALYEPRVVEIGEGKYLNYYRLK